MSDPESLIGFFTTDTGLVIRSWDDWLVGVTGFSAKDICGKHITEVIPDAGKKRLLSRFEKVISEGTVEILSPAFHHYIIPCPPKHKSELFDRMRQKVTIAPLKTGEIITGAVVTIEDVTEIIEHENRLSQAMSDENWKVRREAVSDLARLDKKEAIISLLRAFHDKHRDIGTLNSVLQVLSVSKIDVLDTLIQFLKEPDADLRIYASQALGETGNPRAVDPLIEALEDGDMNVRYHCIEALGKLKARKAVSRLIEIVESKDFFLAFPAIESLSAIGDAAAAVNMVPLLGDEFLMAPAADFLGEIGDEAAIEPLLEFLNKPDSPSSVIASAVSKIYDRFENRYGEGGHIMNLFRASIKPAGIQNLLDALRTAQDEDIRPLALILGWLEGQAVEKSLIMLLGNPSARKEVVNALVRHGNRVVELLTGQLLAEDLEIRQAALIALGRIGNSTSVPAITDVLKNDRELTIIAAGALAKIGDPGAFESLLGMIGHSDASVRQAVISALNSIGHPDMPNRIAPLLNDPNPKVRESAVKIAGYFGYSENAGIFFEHCHDPDEEVRRAIVENLPYFEDKRVMPALIQALRNETPKVRAAAARALAQVEDPSVCGLLIDSLNDEDPWVRYFALRSIGRLDCAGAFERLKAIADGDTARHVRLAAIESIGHTGEERAVEFLAPLIEFPEYDIARAAIKALSLINHPQSLAVLKSATRIKDPARLADVAYALGEMRGPGIAELLQWVAASNGEDAVVHTALNSLGSVSAPEAVYALIDLCIDPRLREMCIDIISRTDEEKIDWIAYGLKHPGIEVRQAVIEALSRIKKPKASEIICKALNDPDPSVRISAITSLGNLGNFESKKKLALMAREDPDIQARIAARKAL